MASYDGLTAAQLSVVPVRASLSRLTSLIVCGNHITVFGCIIRRIVANTDHTQCQVRERRCAGVNKRLRCNVAGMVLADLDFRCNARHVRVLFTVLRLRQSCCHLSLRCRCSL
jgi:hypothetical protein